MKYDESVNNVWQRTVTYTYWNTGDVSNITIEDKDDPLGVNKRRDLAHYYPTRGQVHLAVWGTFTVGANGDPVAGSYVPSAAREFRYGSDPRARYAWRDWSTNGGSSDYTTWTAAGPLHWTDYDGAEPYLDGDITFDAQQNPAVTVGVQLFGSAGQRTAATGATRYFHADLVGSVGLRSDSSGAASGRITYTAFGEVVTRSAGTEDQRYAYCGQHGYESGLLALDGKPGSEPVTLQHVGARWYQSGIGRFVQRDPIGLAGGRNEYAYCAASPLMRIDAIGHEFVSADNGPVWARWLLNATGGQGHVPVLDPGPAQTAVLVVADTVSLLAPGAGLVKGVFLCARALNGAKRTSELVKHIRNLWRAGLELQDLQITLTRSVGPKVTGPLQREIGKRLRDIEGHIKEISQKWPGTFLD